MPACVECGEALGTLVRVEGGVVVQRLCPNCNRACDEYAELDPVQRCLAVVLLHVSAFRHYIFNALTGTATLACIVLVASLLEVYTVTVVAELHALGPSAVGDATARPLSIGAITAAISDTIALASDVGPANASDAAVATAARFIEQSQGVSLKLVSVGQHLRDRLPAMGAAAPLRIALSLVEVAFLGLCAVWAGGKAADRRNFPSVTASGGSSPRRPTAASGSDAASSAGTEAPGGGSFSGPMPNNSSLDSDQSASGGSNVAAALGRAVALSRGATFLLAPFLIWDIPLYLVPLADVNVFLWLLAALQACRVRPFGAVLVVTGTVAARYFFRHVMQWAPQLLGTTL